MGKNSKGAPAAAKRAAGLNKEPELAKVNLQDGSAIKRALDEAATEALTSSGYTEDHYVSNVKIAVSLLLCSLAATAQFWPQKYPQNWLVLVVCVVLYAVGTAGLSLFTSTAEGDAFLFLTSKNLGQAGQLRVTSQLPRFTYFYKLTIATTEAPAASSELSLDVTHFFTEEGILVRPKFETEVQYLLTSLRSKKGQ
ncbi:hypothetical protein WJX73_007939 [Symbiochloris irregularis]|uniref:Signal peptidase complex subunit 2 n=1 Tax=Symbiochloris irregularis TaxID=706552 RepID=A0AAW1Q418_9CHLO